MAKKKEESGTAKKTIYVVAPGRAFTHGGVMYAEGDEITAAAFSSEEVFNRVVATGGIVEKTVEAENSETPADGSSDTVGGDTGSTGDGANGDSGEQK